MRAICPGVLAHQGNPSMNQCLRLVGCPRHASRRRHVTAGRWLLFSRQEGTERHCEPCRRDHHADVPATWRVTIICPEGHPWDWGVCHDHKEMHAAQVAAVPAFECPDETCPGPITAEAFCFSQLESLS